MIRITEPGQIGPAISDLRAMHGLNQGDLCRLSGLRQNRVSAIERGKEIPETRTLLAILGAMGIGLAFTPVDDNAAPVDPRWERLIDTVARHIRLAATETSEEQP